MVDETKNINEIEKSDEAKEPNGIKNAARVKKWFPVFAVNMIAGVFAYSLLMVNQLVNQMDGMWHGSVSYANGHELSNGRWFWRFLDRGRFYLSPDPVTSIISLALFVIGFILVLDLFDVRSRVSAILASLMFAVNISVLASLSYRYMSPTFAMSFFLSVLAAYIMVQARKKYIAIVVPAVLISLMMGLYQADIGATCLVVLLYISLCIYKGDKTLKETGLLTVKCIVSAVLGMGLYYVLLYVNLWYYEVSLDSYNGTDSYGPVGMLLNLPLSISHAYSDYRNYYGQIIARTNMFGGRLYKAAFILLAICYAYGALKLFKKSRVRAVLFILTLMLVPVASNAVLLMAYSSVTSVQMTIPVSMSIPALLCLDSVILMTEPGSLNPAGSAKLLQLGKLYRIVTAVVMALLIYGNYIATIYDQQAMFMGRQSMLEMSREIISTLQIYNLYHPYYKYVFIGSPSDNPCFARNFAYDEANRYAQVGTWSADDTRMVVQSWQGFFTYEMGINMMIADDDKLKEALSDETVKNMPIFPEFGCCAMVNDVVVVKLSDNLQ